MRTEVRSLLYAMPYEMAAVFQLALYDRKDRMEEVARTLVSNEFASDELFAWTAKSYYDVVATMVAAGKSMDLIRPEVIG